MGTDQERHSPLSKGGVVATLPGSTPRSCLLHCLGPPGRASRPPHASGRAAAWASGLAARPPAGPRGGPA
eukprot:scaffold155774_cov34-Prasinocladus_malaysianus.AAC.1